MSEKHKEHQSRPCTYPPGLSIPVNDRVWFRGDGDVCPTSLNEVVVGFHETKRRDASKSHRRASLELGEVQRRVTRYVDAVQSDGGARRNRGRYSGVCCHVTRISDRRGCCSCLSCGGRWRCRSARGRRGA